jgi:tape measure domain-containing protein
MPDSNARVTGDFSSLISGAENAARSITKIGASITGIGAASKTFDVLTGALGGTLNILGRVGLAAQGLEAIGRTGVGMANGLLKGNAALEMTTISFKTLLGSASAADDMIKQLTKFAASTPFELTGLEANTQKLLAFGFQAKDIVPLMTSMGDAIAALGGTQDNLNSLVYVMGQMRGEAHLNAGDIMQMTNLGIPAMQMLADAYHVTTGEMQAMISKGLVPGTKAVDIFTTGLEQKYGGMMAAQSATFSGMISNLQDWATATSITLTKPLFEPAKKGLQELLDYVQSPAGTAAVNKLAADIQAGVDRITKIFKDAQTPVKVFLAAFQGKEVDGIKGFDTLTGQLAGKLGTLAKKAFELYQTFSPLTTAFDVLKGLVTGGLDGGLAALEKRITGMGKALGLDLKPVFDTVVSFIHERVLPVLKSMGEWFELHIIPVIKALALTFDKDIFPALGRFGNFLAVKVFPVLGDFLDWFSIKIIPVLGAVVKVILDKVIPTLFNWWQVLATFLKPIIEAIANFIVKDFIPNFNKLADAINKNVMPVLKTIAGFLGGALGVAFSLVGKIIGGVIDIIGRLVGTLDGIIHLDPGKAWDALTGKTKDLDDATKNLKDQNDDLFTQLKGIGTTTVDDFGKTTGFFTGLLDKSKDSTDNLLGSFNTLWSGLSGKGQSVTIEATNKLNSLSKAFEDGKISIDDYQKGVNDVKSSLGITNLKTMEDAKTQVDALTKKYLDGKGTFDDYQKAIGDVAKKLNNEGQKAIEDSKTKIADLNKKYADGKINLDDYKTGFNAIIVKMENEGKSASEKAKDQINDLNQKYNDGKISFDKYKQGVDDVNKALDAYNSKQIAKKTLEANFPEFIKNIGDITAALGQMALTPPAWFALLTPEQLAKWKDWQKYGTGIYNPPVVTPHAAGTSSAARGLALVGEQGAELIQSLSGQLLLATRPLLLNLAGGERIFNASQTRAMLPSPASPAQIHNMYQSAGPSYSNVNSHNQNNFQFRADMPVDLNHALQRYYNQQVFKYGR